MGFGLNYFYIKNISLDFFSLLKTKLLHEKILIIIWLLMPFFMMISKSLVDIFITLTAAAFLVFSILNFSWSWLKISWIKWALFFFCISLVSAYFSSLSENSLINGFVWIRFPLYAAAISCWLIKDKEVLIFTILMNFLSIILIFILMGAESIFTEHKIFEWPFRNPLNGPFIHRIGIIFFAFSFLILFSEMKYKIEACLFILLSIFFSLLTEHRVGNFSFIIIITILCFWPRFDIKKSLAVIISFCIVLTLYFLYNEDKLDRYFFGVYNFTNSSLLQYVGLWKTGIIVFIDNFLIGIGPTNVQNYLAENLIVNYDPYKNSEHPHNHFIQAFAETGLFGGIIYCLIIYHLIKEIYISTKKDLSSFNLLLTQSAFISSICLLWPFANTYDFFGQQQNAFLWYCISIYLVISKIRDLKINFFQN